MTLKQFKRAIAIGNGLPFVRFRGKFPTHFSPAIFNAAVRNLAYDAQCEGSRDYYAFQLLTHSVDWEQLIRQFFDHFSKQEDPDDYHNLNQLFRLAYRFHQAGFREARAIIFDRFDYFSHPDRAETFASKTMIQLGIPGIVRYARAAGRLLRLDKTHPNHEKYLKRDLKKYAPKGYKKHLRRLARKDHDIATYLKLVIDDKSPAFPKHIPRTASTYDYIRGRLARGGPVILRPQNVEQLTEAQIEEFAHGLIGETVTDQLRNHLRLFAHVPFPLDVRYLYQLLRVEDDITQSALAKALGQIEAPEIRRLAVARLWQGSEPAIAVEMLGVNYRSKDEALLVHALKNTSDQHELHQLGFALSYFSKLHPGATFFDFSLAYVKRSRCAICRRDKLKYLLEHDRLPEDLRAALWYDCHEATRDLAKVTPPVR